MYLDAKPEFQKVFEDGLNHDVALINGGFQGIKKQHVLKCFSAPHSSAINSQDWASKLGVAPDIHYADPDSTYCVMDYLKADSISPESLSSKDLSAIAQALNGVHSAPIPEFATTTGIFDLLKFCGAYLQTAGERAQTLHQQIITPLNSFVNDTTPMSFCHNDLVVGNCFVVNGQAQFIDWEYAQLHNPWFDLAAIIYYLQLDNKQAAAFLDNYEAGWSVFVGTSVFYTSQLSLLWADMLWHLAKFGPDFWPRLEVKLNDLEQLLTVSESLV